MDKIQTLRKKNLLESAATILYKGSSHIFVVIYTYSMILNLSFKVKTWLTWNLNISYLSSVALKILIVLKYLWKINKRSKSLFLWHSKINTLRPFLTQELKISYIRPLFNYLKKRSEKHAFYICTHEISDTINMIGKKTYN